MHPTWLHANDLLSGNHNNMTLYFLLFIMSQSVSQTCMPMDNVIETMNAYMTTLLTRKSNVN